MEKSPRASLVRTLDRGRGISRVVRPRLVIAAIVAAQLTAIGTAFADSSCDPGDLCIWDDDDNGRSGSMSGTNRSWNFGSGNNWNNRADFFYNYGRSCSVRIYWGTGYSGGVAVDLDLGEYDGDHWNTGQSNKWYGCS